MTIRDHRWRNAALVPILALALAVDVRGQPTRRPESLFDGGRPRGILTHVPTLEEAVEFWRYRDATELVADAVRNVPDVAVVVIAGATDHVQLAPDHPHIRAQVNAFEEAGAKLIRKHVPATVRSTSPNARARFR